MPDTQRIWIFTEGKPPFMFDAVLEEAHTSRLVTTENPIETGVPVTDHAYMMPYLLQVEAGIGDVWLGMRDNVVAEAGEDGQVAVVSTDVEDMPWLRGEGGGDSSTRTQRAFQLMLGLQRSAEPFRVETGLRTCENMVIEEITAKQDKDSSAVLYFRASLKEIFRVGTETVTFPPRKAGKTKRQAAKKADNGEKKANAVTDANKAESALSNLGGASVKAAMNDILGAIGLGGG